MTVGRNFDVVYSPDDGGWYGEEFPSGRTTAVFDTKAEAVKAALLGEWDEAKS